MMIVKKNPDEHNQKNNYLPRYRENEIDIYFHIVCVYKHLLGNILVLNNEVYTRYFLQYRTPRSVQKHLKTSHATQSQ